MPKSRPSLARIAAVASLLAVAGCTGGAPARREAAARAFPPAPTARTATRTVAYGTVSEPAVAHRATAHGDFDASNLTLEAAVAAAQAQGKKVAVFVVTAWCGYCRKLETQTLSRPEVRAEMASWFTVREDADTPTGRAVASRLGATAFPTIVLLDGQGGVARRLLGYQEPASFASSLRQAR